MPDAPTPPRAAAPAAVALLLLVGLLAGAAAVASAPAARPTASAAAPAGASAAAPSAGQGAAALPTIDLDEVRVGQRGYGLSVFAGGQPERFDVEVIGVMRNLGPDTSYILARLSGHGLESSGVAAGMSGSPVFLDGRLAGAVAFGWAFSKEAVCGITPIALMRRLTTLGDPLPGLPPPPVKLDALLAGRVPPDLLERQLARLRPAAGAVPEGAVSGIAWSAGGFGELARGVLRQALGSIAPAGHAVVPTAAAAPAAAPLPGAAGAAAPSGPSGAMPPPAADLVPGSAVAAVLIDGDFQLAATGTVTDHVGDRILAFGHSFLGLGPVEVPMSAADVVTVLSSQNTSFKIANVGQTVGAFEQDRSTGIEGRLGKAARMIPMTLRIAGPGLPSAAVPSAAAALAPQAAAAPGAPGRARQFKVRLADIPEMLPMLAGSTLLSGLDAASYSGGPQSIDLTAHFDLDTYGPLVVHQSFDGDNAAAAMSGHLLALVGYLEQNPLARVRIRSLDVEVEQAPRPMAANILAAYADRAVVHPGDRLAVHVELKAYRGERFRRTLSLDLPLDLPSGRYTVLVGDGASADGARLALAPIDPANIGQALALLRSLHSRRDLTLLGFHPGAGLAASGEVLPELPGSLRSLWEAAASAGGAVALRSAIVQELHQPMAMPVDGLVRLDLDVRRRDEPASPQPASTELANVQGER